MRLEPAERRGEAEPIRAPLSPPLCRPASAGPWEPRLPRPLGVACAGGMARCFTVLGALVEMEDSGLRADVLTGSSSGALIAVLVSALGARGALRLGRETCRRGNRAWSEFVGPGRLDRLGWGRGRGWVTLMPLGRFAQAHTGARRIEDLPTPVGIGLTDLGTGQTRFVTRGRLDTALAASCSFTGAQAIRLADGYAYVDGGLSVNVPVAACRVLGARTVLALDALTDVRRLRASEPLGTVIPRRQWKRIAGIHPPLAPDVPPDYWLAMGSPDLPMVDLRRYEHLVDAGRRAAARLLDRLQADATAGLCRAS